MRGRLFGPRRLLRVDLHGVSSFGADDERALIRWEWVEGIAVGKDSVIVRGAEDSIVFPAGAFGMEPETLAEELELARSIQSRSDVIFRLSSGADDGDQVDRG